jgi:hypothetical protein
VKLAGAEIGNNRPLFLIAGPCVIESEALVQEVAGRLQEICVGLGLPLVFKASFDKAGSQTVGNPSVAMTATTLRVGSALSRSCACWMAPSRAGAVGVKPSGTFEVNEAITAWLRAVPVEISTVGVA